MGPVLVPKSQQGPIAPEQETSDQISFTNPETKPSPAEPVSSPHKLRTILFLLAGLILLALLILLLVRGPVHRNSLPRGAGPMEALMNESDVEISNGLLPLAPSYWLADPFGYRRITRSPDSVRSNLVAKVRK